MFLASPSSSVLNFRMFSNISSKSTKSLLKSVLESFLELLSEVLLLDVESSLLFLRLIINWCVTMEKYKEPGVDTALYL